jgi:hypothetical protein
MPRTEEFSTLPNYFIAEGHKSAILNDVFIIDLFMNKGKAFVVGAV